MAEAEVKGHSADSSDRETVCNQLSLRFPTRVDLFQDAFEDAQDTKSRPVSQESAESSASIAPSVTEAGPTSSTSTPRSSRALQNSSIEEDEPARSTSEVASDSNSNRLSNSHSTPSSLRNSKSLAEETRLGSDSVEESESTDAQNISQKGPVPAKPPRSKGISGTFPWGQGSKQAQDTKATTPSSAKKPGMGFAWFRKPSATIDTNSIPQSKPLTARDRRDTAASFTSIQSNPDLMLSKLDEGNDQDESTLAQRQRNSLRDRFKMLRMREEAGISPMEGHDVTSPGAGGSALAGLIGRSASIGVGVASPTSTTEEKEDGLAVASPLQSPIPTSPGAAPTSQDPNLAPGTASGIAAGPSALKDPEAGVDWDLWQAVVYEGPAAVARTSAEELSRAIASGIPSAIRGVVWQVLAQSKNEELEAVYRELVARGTDKDRELTAGLQGHAPSHSLANGSLKEKQSVTSSASSVHSDRSTPATTATNGMTSPTPSQSQDGESMAKLQSAMIAERKKKAQEDRTAIQKLEKVIRRDLGARTSYSKYATAAGLQDGLFGVCKAYALFDEGVGYAQGMNFLVMPLLFNVSHVTNLQAPTDRFSDA